MWLSILKILTTVADWWQAKQARDMEEVKRELEYYKRKEAANTLKENINAQASVNLNTPIDDVLRNGKL